MAGCVVKLLRGQPGSKVTITIARSGNNDPRDFPRAGEDPGLLHGWGHQQPARALCWMTCGGYIRKDPVWREKTVDELDEAL